MYFPKKIISLPKSDKNRVECAVCEKIFYPFLEIKYFFLFICYLFILYARVGCHYSVDALKICRINT